MGATNQIKGTNLSLQLEGKKCPQCEQIFTKQEIDDRNFDIWFDTTNDVKLIDLENIPKEETKHLYFPTGRTGYQLTIWIRSIEHEECPETEKCQGCYGNFLEDKVKEFDDYYYCEPCYKQISKDHDF